MKRNNGLLFILVSLISLLLGIYFGVIGSFQFLFPQEVFLQSLPFIKTRPIHVTLVLSWIVLCAAGGIYYYMPQIAGQKLFSESLAKIHFIIFVLCGGGIALCYSLGIFGGREYLEFPYYFIFPILFGWILFAINFFKTAKPDFKGMPVYLWMWATGSVFMILTLSESYLWLLPYFRDNIIRDVTVQWKSYGAFIGAWNMLVYGTAAYLMCKIKNDDSFAKNKMTFALYFVGFTNMLFNWGHHTYFVPAAPWIKHVSYIVSMIELVILGKIIWDWKKTLTTAEKYSYHLPYRFLLASEFWIFMNLILALLISIPAINIFSHGTHITVAHAMGTTIGINTMILLASVFFIVTEKNQELAVRNKKVIASGFRITQIFLLLFWLSLIAAGMRKGYLSYYFPEITFNEMMSSVRNYLIVFAAAGVFLTAGISMMIIPLLKNWKRWTGSSE
ncbi:MAG: cbb3-type cytochrome c oxidase subunit I [Bacteroidia bacterium]|nr:cbb3-type cytochrome c oxidase subunit I [Bacteroidia bacterium]